MAKELDRTIYCDAGAGIYLRLMTDEDTDEIVRWRNLEEVRKRFIYQKPFTAQGHREWIQNMVETGKVVQLMICDLYTDRPLGSVYVRDIDREHSKGEYGIFIGEDDARGRGVGTVAARLMLRYCFGEMKLHRVFLRALADNLQAIRSYEKAGFQREALLREDVKINEEYRDVILMGILESEYQE